MSSLAVDSQPPAPAETNQHSVGAIPFLGLCAQLLAVLALLHAYGIERELGLLKLTPLILVGFAVHAWLPIAMRMGWFLALSLAAVTILFEPALAAVLIGTGLGLILICHLPIPWALRIGLLLAAGAGLSALRAGAVDQPWVREYAPVLPILGSIFMFRMVLYIHAERTDPRPASLFQRLSYFFLLPNLVFALFPIVDYRTFQRTYYDAPAAEIYQKGIRWMLRGVFHLLLYRLIYLHFTPAAAEVVDVGTFVLYMVSAYALYLRVSGLFHLIIGMLCLFGFHLPETHHNYFLASGFNDLWRRINIYWKDFMMKIVYYPIFVRMRRRNGTQAMVVATFAVFLISWLLHSYQLFWVRGTFPLTVVDAIFWILFAVFVLANSLIQVRSTRRSRGRRRLHPRGAAIHATKVVAMFAFMCAFWTFWTAGTIPAWTDLLQRAAGGPRIQLAWLGAGLLGLVAIGTAWQLGHQAWAERQSAPSPPSGSRGVLSRSPAWAAIGWAALLSVPLIAEATPQTEETLVASVVHQRLNDADESELLRGYYEEALAGDALGTGQVHAAANLGGARAIGEMATMESKKPKTWVNLSATGALSQKTPHPLILDALRPNVSVTFCESTLTTNRWGMRDQDYTLEKPARTHRIALLGASVVMGSGVENDEVFEAIVEERLNANNKGLTYDRYEILNFAVSGLTIIQQVPYLEHIVEKFDVDTVMLVAHNVDEKLLPLSVIRLIHQDRWSGYPALDPILKVVRTNYETKTTSVDTRAKWKHAMLEWSYKRMVKFCKKRNIRPVYVFLQHPQTLSAFMRKRGRQMRALAKKQGFHVIELDGELVYPPDRVEEMRLRPWDEHPSVAGHRSIAEELHTRMLEHERPLGLGFTEAYAVPGTSTSQTSPALPATTSLDAR